MILPLLRAHYLRAWRVAVKSKTYASQSLLPTRLRPKFYHVQVQYVEMTCAAQVNHLR